MQTNFGNFSIYMIKWMKSQTTAKVKQTRYALYNLDANKPTQ